MHKILVTGGTGYIGSHTVVELQNAGYEVVIADNLSNSSATVLDSITKITGKKPFFSQIDVGDEAATRKLFQEYRFDGIIHFAAYKSVGESVEHPLKYYKNNLSSLINLVQVATDYQTDNFVFSSSCSVYGEPVKLPVSELSPVQKAESPYANTKQICEEILSDQSRVSSLKVILLRYFNPVGSHESGLIGELPIGPPTNLFPVLTQAAIGKRPQLKVFGNDYPTPDGTCIRDYIHVVDVAKAHVTALHRMLENKQKKKVEVFNLGTGKGTSVMEVINTFEDLTGVKVNYELTPRRAGDVAKVYADTSLANTELGWKTELGLDEMVRSAWKWEQFLNQTNGK